MFDEQLQTIHSHWQAASNYDEAAPMVLFDLRPSRDRQWTTDNELQQAIETHQFVATTKYAVLQTDNLQRMEWGLYSTDPRDPTWALTISGLLWAAVNLRRDEQEPLTIT